MYKLAQNIYKPMAAHTPKVTNPFAGAKPMPLNINGTGYTPPVKTQNISTSAKDNSYFGRLYQDLQGIGTGINNFVKSTVDTGNRAVKGWGRLLDPTSSATLGQRFDWLKKGLTSVKDDFAPGLAQGAINLPANTVKGLSDIGTGIANSLSGGLFNNAKKNVDEFTSKITDPFKVNFAGNRKGVQQEAFNVGQTVGEVATTAGTGAAVKAGTQFLKNTMSALKVNKIEPPVFKNNLNNFIPTRNIADITHKINPLKEKLGIKSYTTYNKRANILRNAMQQKYSTPGVVGANGELWDGNTLYWLARKNKITTF